MCTPSPAARSMLTEADRRWPNRNKASDGICPSPEHLAASPNSDHNDGGAVDLTHDPAHGVDTDRLTAELIARNDVRVSYIIRNRQEFNRKNGFKPVPYTGKNPHTTHMHVSLVKGAPRMITSDWFPGAANAEPLPFYDDIVVDPGSLVVDQPAPEPAEPAGPLDFLAALVSGEFWLTVAKFIVGVLLIVVGVAVFILDQKQSLTRAAAQVVGL